MEVLAHFLISASTLLRALFEKKMRKFHAIHSVANAYLAVGPSLKITQPSVFFPFPRQFFFSPGDKILHVCACMHAGPLGQPPHRT